MIQTNDRTIISVSELNKSVRKLLESDIGRVWISGEISNFTQPSSGHWYFTLKDENAQVRCAMFRGRNQYIRFTPKQGQQITLRAKLSVYEPRGEYQLIGESMTPDGEGLLQHQFEQLKEKLAQQNYFSPEHKKEIPPVYRLGVVSSKTGAAIQDILHVLERRAPHIDVILYDSQVQGDLAPAQLIAAIEKANERNEVDALLLTRGGGSLEDLSCFNNEQLAYCIYNSTLPIISAVGHEIDFTIADFVADVRAPTPSAGAELLSSEQVHLKQQMMQLSKQLQQQWNYYISKHQQRLTLLQHQLESHHPERILEKRQQQFDEMQLKLHQCMMVLHQKYTSQLQPLKHRLFRYNPQHHHQTLQEKQKNLSTRLINAMNRRCEKNQERLKNAAALLEQLSPLATLARGYSVTHHNKKLIHFVDALQVNDELHTKVHSGDIISIVKSVHKKTT